MILRHVADQMADLLFPPRCQVCGALNDAPYCETCRAKVEFIRHPFCQSCGQPLDPQAHDAGVCAECRQPRAFSGARAVGLYVGTLREAIIRFKYQGRRRLAQPLGEMLAELALDDEAPGSLPLAAASAIVPVPLYPRRRAWRGFDQAELLSGPLGDAMGLPVWTDVLARVRDTTPQVSIAGSQRLHNVRNAFETRKSWKLKGRSIVLVDDVFTTGATISECANVLRAAGATAVYALTVARTAPPWHPASVRRADTDTGLWGDEP
ncbi:MAG: ComF family protein [Armatimonadetes bacterium]|nr:ComF family protein [Armatimonadota bacterium]